MRGKTPICKHLLSIFHRQKHPLPPLKHYTNFHVIQRVNMALYLCISAPAESSPVTSIDENYLPDNSLPS